MGEITRAVIEHAQRNGGVVTRSEALALGLAPTTLATRVRDGVLVRVARGVYALPGASEPDLVILAGACRKLGAVVSHQSAAVMHTLDRYQHVKPSVSVPRRRSNVYPGVTVHQLTDLTDAHIVVRDGLPITTPERTVIDLAAVLGKARLERVIDNGLTARRLDLDLLVALFTQLGRRGKPGTAQLRTILSQRGTGYRAPESELERRLIELIRDAQLPAPTLQFQPPWLAPTNGRVDLAYPGHQLVIEGDSRRWHTLLNSFELDRKRDNAAQLAGWRTLRFIWDEIMQEPEKVVRAIAQALEHDVV